MKVQKKGKSNKDSSQQIYSISVWISEMTTYHYLHSNYFPVLCCHHNILVIMLSGLLQVYVNLGNLQRISNCTLYLISSDRLFLYHDTCLWISCLILSLIQITYCLLHFYWVQVHPSQPMNWIHNYYVPKFSNQYFNPLGYCWEHSTS